MQKTIENLTHIDTKEIYQLLIEIIPVFQEYLRLRPKTHRDTNQLFYVYLKLIELSKSIHAQRKIKQEILLNIQKN